MDDQEQQQDEVSALQSIYDGASDSFSVSKEECIRRSVAYEASFQVSVQLPTVPFEIKLPHDCGIQGINSENEGDKKSGEKSEGSSLYSFEVHYLPLLVLDLEIPSNYPSKCPPSYQISCPWLAKSQIKLVCNHLDNLWHPGEVVLFTWFSFLKDDLFEFLGLKSPLDLSKAFYEIVLFQRKVAARDRWYKPPRPHELKGGTDDLAPADTNGFKPSVENMGSLAKGVAPVKEGRRKSSRCRKHAHSLVRRRIISPKLTPSELFNLIKEVDKSYREIEFNNGWHDCSVCWASKLGTDCIMFAPCGHVTCKECAAEYFTVRIKDGEVTDVTCPCYECVSEATPHQVKELVSKELFEKYDSLLLAQYFSLTSDVVECPRCNQIVWLEREANVGQCSCSFNFCVHCRKVTHGVSPCELNKDIVERLLNQWNKSTPAQKEAMERRYGKRHIEKALEEANSLKYLSENSKQCPRCTAFVDKVDGCNKMTCGKCKCFFCWLCMEVVHKDNPYGHFSKPNTPCYNQLFQGVEIEFEDDDDEDLDEDLDVDPEWFAMVQDYQAQDEDYEEEADFELEDGDYDIVELV